MSQINILEAFIKKYNQFILLIIGLPCTNKSVIAKELEKDLNLPIIYINSYVEKNNFIKKEVENIKFKLYDHTDNYNWDKLNKDVDKIIKDKGGLILYGSFIDTEKINFNINFTFFLNMNTTLCRDVLIKKKFIPYKEDDARIKIYFEKIFNPLYDTLKLNININKFYNIKEKTKFNEIYDNLFDTLMDLIFKKLK
jgi:shikimate kinase